MFVANIVGIDGPVLRREGCGHEKEKASEMQMKAVVLRWRCWMVCQKECTFAGEQFLTVIVEVAK